SITCKLGRPCWPKRQARGCPLAAAALRLFASSARHLGKTTILLHSSAPLLSLRSSLRFAQRLCVSPETSSARPAPKASRSALSASSAPGRHPYRSIPQRCSSSCFSLRYGSASLRLRGGTEATAHVSASMNQDVSLRLGSA